MTQKPKKHTLEAEIPRGVRVAGGNARIYGSQRAVQSYEIHVTPGRILKAKEGLRLALEPISPLDFALEDRQSRHETDKRCKDEIDGIMPEISRLGEKQAEDAKRLKAFTLTRVFPVLHCAPKKACEPLKQRKPVYSTESIHGHSRSRSARQEDSQTIALLPFVHTNAKGSSPIYRRPPSTQGAYELTREARLKEEDESKELLIGPPMRNAKIQRQVDNLPFDPRRKEYDKELHEVRMVAKLRLASLMNAYMTKLRRFQAKNRARSPMPVIRQIALDVKKQGKLFNWFQNAVK